MVKITAIGGYGEIGRNMTLVDFGDEAVVLDMGIHVDNYIRATNEGDIMDVPLAKLISGGAVPDISVVEDRSKIQAIIPTHAHLDHIGAIPFLASKFRCPIICTPFCASVIKYSLQDKKSKAEFDIKKLNVNASICIGKRIRIEFINMTHSTPQTVMVALHYDDELVLYANDFKLDYFPVLGKKPNIKRLHELGEKGIDCAIVDSLYADSQKKTPSEAVAKQMLKDVLFGGIKEGKGIVVTTFSSHLARLKSIVALGKQLDRKIVFLGRSLHKYVVAGEEVGLIEFTPDVELVKYKRAVAKRLKEIIKEGKEKYIIVCTGNQGEGNSVLTRMAFGELDFAFDSHDSVIFSCSVIPNELNTENRKVVESALSEKGVRIFKDVHVSGHAGKEDLREFLEITQPRLVLPAHSTMERAESMIGLAELMGLNVRALHNGESVDL